MIKYFSGPRQLMNRNNELHYALFDFNTNIEMKVFIAILANATMIYRTNNTERTQTFSLDGYLSSDSFLPRSSLNFETLQNMINNFESTLFFEMLRAENKVVVFKLSSEYKDMINYNSFNKIDLSSLKSVRDIRSTKLFILTQLAPTGFLALNYLLRVLNLNEIKTRKDKIAKIKKAFKNIDIEATYKYPKNKHSATDEHYKFYYNNVKEDDLKKDINDEIDKIFNTDDLDLDFELFEKEEYEKKNKAESEMTTKKTDGYSPMHKHYLGIKTNKDKHEEEYEDPDWHIPF